MLWGDVSLDSVVTFLWLEIYSKAHTGTNADQHLYLLSEGKTESLLNDLQAECDPVIHQCVKESVFLSTIKNKLKKK